MEKVIKFTDNEINESRSRINNLMNALLEINSGICMEMSKFSSDRAILVCGTDAIHKISDALLETEKFYHSIKLLNE